MLCHAIAGAPVECIQKYTVADGETISEEDIVELISEEISKPGNDNIDTVGNKLMFYNNHMYDGCISTLTSNKVIAGHKHYDSTYKLKLYLFDISGTTVTETTSIILDHGDGSFVLSALSETSCILVYSYYNGTINQIYARVINIDENIITAGTPELVSPSEMYGQDPSVSAITNNLAIVTWCDRNVSPVENRNYGRANLLTISGYNIDVSSNVIFDSSDVYITYDSMCALDTTRALVTWSDTEENKGKACVLSVDNGSISPGSVVTFHDTSSVLRPAISALSSKLAIVVFGDDGNNDRESYCILNIDNQIITPGTIVEGEENGCTYCSITSLSATKAMAVIKSGSWWGEARVLIVNGSNISLGPLVTFNNRLSEWFVITSLSSKKAIVIYEDEENGGLGHGSCNVLETAHGQNNVIGIAKESKSAGEVCKVGIFSKSPFHYRLSNLTKGLNYYIGLGGSIVDRIPSPYSLNINLSSNEEEYLIGEAVADSVIRVTGSFN